MNEETRRQIEILEEDKADIQKAIKGEFSRVCDDGVFGFRGLAIYNRDYRMFELRRAALLDQMNNIQEQIDKLKKNG